MISEQKQYESIKAKNIDLFHLGRSTAMLEKGQFVKSSSHSNIARSYAGGSLKSMKSVGSVQKEEIVTFPINIDTKSRKTGKEADKDFTKINYQDFTNTEESKQE